MRSFFCEEKPMKNYLIRTVAICLALGLLAALAAAQNQTISAAAGDRYVVSARAGGVNYVEGTVAVVRKSGKSGLLLKGDTLQVGDRVSTGENGRAEILLNPGSFLRLGGTSAFEFNTTSLEDLELRLDGGSAILEVFAADEFKVNVRTPSTLYSLIKSGIFRIDINGERTSTLRVWKGLATVGSDNQVKAGRTATAPSANSVAVTKFNRDEKDSLDVWSKSRSKGLAEQTASLRRRDIQVPLMRGFLGRRWNFLGSFGLWISDPFSAGYSFLPFNSGWCSPYGYVYGNGMSWWFHQGYPMYLPPTSGGGGTGTGTGTGTGAGTSTGPPRTSIGERQLRRIETGSPMATDQSSIPPFIRMQQANGGGIGGGRHQEDPNASPGGYSPTYSPSSPSSSAPYIPSAPSTAGQSETKTPAGTKQP